VNLKKDVDEEKSWLLIRDDGGETLEASLITPSL